jgi:hypothetical protein
VSSHQFYLLLFGVSLFGGLSFVLLLEVCKLRNLSAGLLDIANEHRDQICRLQGAEAALWADSSKSGRKVEDLQAIASVHWDLLSNLHERLKLVESSHFFLVRKPPEVVGEPGEVHPFATDAFVTVPPKSAAA